MEMIFLTKAAIIQPKIQTTLMTTISLFVLKQFTNHSFFN